MKLYSNSPANVFVQMAMVAADMACLNVEVVVLDKAAQNAKDFKAKHLNGKFPVLELDSGEMIFESTAITRFFASHAPNSGLFG